MVTQTTCHVPDCDKDLYQSKSGRKTLLCETHEKEYRKGTLRLRSLKARPAAEVKKPAARTRKKAA